MELVQAIEQRRSIRKFTAQPLTEAQIEALLEAIRWAPSWNNTQVWEVIVVTEAETKQALADLLIKNPATKATANAAAVFALAAKKNSSGFYLGQPTTNKGDWLMFDMGLACQNLVLRAHDLGLGSVIVGLFDADRAKKILGVPEGYSITAWVAVGHPDKDPKAPPRKQISEFLHKESW